MSFLLLFAAALSCPALNTATAAGAFGDMQLAVTHAAKGAGYTCTFTKPEYQLTVEVAALATPDRFAQFKDAACHDAHDLTSLKAIGNEAFACTLGSSGRMEEKIVGRVRDQAFVVFLNTTDKMADAKSIRNKVTVLADQVAGNLF